MIRYRGQDLNFVVFCGGGVVMVDFTHIFHGHLCCDDHKWVQLFNSIKDWLSTQWGRVLHICASKLITIGSDNGLSHSRHQAIIWSNARILLIWPIGTNFNEISIDIHTFSFNKIHLKMLSGKYCPFCLGLNVSTGNNRSEYPLTWFLYYITQWVQWCVFCVLCFLFPMCWEIGNKTNFLLTFLTIFFFKHMRP